MIRQMWGGRILFYIKREFNCDQLFLTIIRTVLDLIYIKLRTEILEDWKLDKNKIVVYWNKSTYKRATQQEDWRQCDSGYKSEFSYFEVVFASFAGSNFTATLHSKCSIKLDSGQKVTQHVQKLQCVQINSNLAKKGAFLVDFGNKKKSKNWAFFTFN